MPGALQSCQWEGWSAASCSRRLPLAPWGCGWARPTDLLNVHSFPEAYLEEPPTDTGPFFQRGSLQLPAPRSPPKKPGALSQSDPSLSSPRVSGSPASSPNESSTPAPPQSHLPDTSAQFPSHLTDGGIGGRPRGPAGGAGSGAAGRGRGRGAEGRPLLRPQLPALWLRLALTLALFPEPRDVTGKQPILVGPRRPPRAGHPTRTRGGPPGAPGTPATRSPD